MTENTIEETQFEEQTSQEETEELDFDIQEQETDDEGSSDVETLKAELEKAKREKARLYARLKQGEIKKPVEAHKSKPNSSLTREEAILFAKGYTEEEVDLANKLAKINGINPLVAAEDDYFKTKHIERINKEKSKQASLGASSSSGKFKNKSSGDMTREEHIEYFNDIMSKA